MTSKSLLRCALASLLAWTLGGPAAAQTVQLVCNEIAVEQIIAGKLLADIYKRAGLTAVVQPLPAARASAMALSGEKQGEVARIQTYANANPSLIKVEPAYYYLITGVFTKGTKITSITSKDALKPYRVGIVRGVAHAEAATASMGNVLQAETYEQLYQMLDGGRIDLALDSATNGLLRIKKQGLKDIHMVGEIGRLELFNLLHPSVKELAPRISASIRAIKASGELARLTRQYEIDGVNEFVSR